MINRVRIVVLGLVVSHGAGLVAMDKNNKNTENPVRNPLSCSAEMRKTAALQIALEEKIEAQNRYYLHCGANAKVEYLHQYSNHDIKDTSHTYFPGR